MNIIQCAFGGVSDNLVICGSEDACIYIWNRDQGELLKKLEGHT